jgi:heparanase 1
MKISLSEFLAELKHNCLHESKFGHVELITLEHVGPGNELSGSGVGTKVSAAQFAADMKELRSVIGVLYDGASLKPLVVAPDGFFDYGWFKQFLTAAGPGGVDVITRHIYNLGPGQEASL